MLRKVNDTFNDGQSDADKYFTIEDQKRFYRLFRKNSVLPAGFATRGNNSLLTTQEFQLRGVQFGNWLSTEDKFDYLSSFYVSMHDMNKILKFKKNNLGFDSKLGICFGSRGVPRAAAHFSANEIIINLSRYYDNDKFMFPTSKMTRFLKTGGAGSMAHEYGHFLDFMFGYYLEPHVDVMLTGSPKSVNWNLPLPNPKKYPYRAQMRKILDTALFSKDGEYSSYGERLRKIKINGDYYRSNVEIWARLFETYICTKLSKRGVNNHFLTKELKTYNSLIVYPHQEEMIPISREIDKLISMMRMKIK